jgi:hypothetical protein
VWSAQLAPLQPCIPADHPGVACTAVAHTRACPPGRCQLWVTCSWHGGICEGGCHGGWGSEAAPLPSSPGVGQHRVIPSTAPDHASSPPAMSVPDAAMQVPLVQAVTTLLRGQAEQQEWDDTRNWSLDDKIFARMDGYLIWSAVIHRCLCWILCIPALSGGDGTLQLSILPRIPPCCSCRPHCCLQAAETCIGAGRCCSRCIITTTSWAAGCLCRCIGEATRGLLVYTAGCLCLASCVHVRGVAEVGCSVPGAVCARHPGQESRRFSPVPCICGCLQAVCACGESGCMAWLPALILRVMCVTRVQVMSTHAQHVCGNAGRWDSPGL